MPCLVCRDTPCDPAHIKSRGAGGGDVPFNVMPLCRNHHTEQHQIGIVTFVQRYSRVRDRLFDLGWSIEGGKLINSQMDLFQPAEQHLAEMY